MTSSWYPKAIELISDPSIDARAILFKIAARRPKAIVDAFDDGSKSRLIDECRSLMKAGELVAAVKLWRNSTGVSLKDAKESVEALV